MIQSYRLQLEYWLPHRYIITAWFKAPIEGGQDEWFTAEVGDEFERTGVAIIYPEHDLLWIIDGSDKTERFKTLENFEEELSRLPRWEATRYAVVEGVNNCDEDGRIVDYTLCLFDCRTEQRLIDVMTCEPVPGRESEVERLRRGIEQLMRGEHFSFW